MSAVGTWVWVPHTAWARPSRYQTMAPFSLVASAWKSTSITSASLPSPARMRSAFSKGDDEVAVQLTAADEVQHTDAKPLGAFKHAEAPAGETGGR